MPYIEKDNMVVLKIHFKIYLNINGKPLSTEIYLYDLYT